MTRGREPEEVLARLGLEPRDITRPVQRPTITADDGTTVMGRDADALDTVIGHESPGWISPGRSVTHLPRPVSPWQRRPMEET